MTRQEIADLLELVIANYPKTFIKDAKATLTLWEMAFSEYPADKVYRAARHHMDVSTEFPTIAHIKKGMGMGEIMYGQGRPSLIAQDQKAISPPKVPIKKIEVYCQGAWACPYFKADMCFGNKEEYDLCNF